MSAPIPEASFSYLVKLTGERTDSIFHFKTFREAYRFTLEQRTTAPIFFRDDHGRLHECTAIPGQETFL
jgi:hypothetical protein